MTMKSFIVLEHLIIDFIRAAVAGHLLLDLTSPAARPPLLYRRGNMEAAPNRLGEGKWSFASLFGEVSGCKNAACAASSESCHADLP
jgi:hypothetical protein